MSGGGGGGWKCKLQLLYLSLLHCFKNMINILQITSHTFCIFMKLNMHIICILIKQWHIFIVRGGSASCCHPVCVGQLGNNGGNKSWKCKLVINKMETFKTEFRSNRFERLLAFLSMFRGVCVCWGCRLQLC